MTDTAQVDFGKVEALAGQIVGLMTGVWVVMPRVTRWLAGWLKHQPWHQP